MPKLAFLMENTIIQRFVNELSKVLTDELPGNTAHEEMMPYLRIGAKEARETKNPRFSAVMLLLFEEENDIKILLIKRSEGGGAHSGQIAFPGGKMEPEDESLKETAIRETFEEVGISRDKIEMIGELSEVYIPPSNFLAKPYVGFLNTSPELLLQPTEVQHIVYFPMKNLMNDAYRKRKPIFLPKYEITVESPYFEAEEHTIWGATALMLNEFRHICLRIPDWQTLV